MARLRVLVAFEAPVLDPFIVLPECTPEMLRDEMHWAAPRSYSQN
jgi:hypothetical protein